MPDLLARWSSPSWREEVDAWVAGVVAGGGRRVTGPGEQVRVRFWSTVVRYPTTGGAVWLKECNPGQGFEGPLLQALSRLRPGAFPRPLAVDAARSRLLLPDLGPTLADSRDRGGDARPAELRSFAVVQQQLAPHRDAVLATGLPSFPAAAAEAYVEQLAEELAALAPEHPQHLDACGRGAVRRGLPWVRDWSAALAGSGLPDSLQHHDLSPRNTARGHDGTPVWFDVGDGFWSHPFAVLQVPVALRTRTWPFGPDWADPVASRLLDAYLEPWTAPGRTRRDLRRLAEPARLLAQLHRAESWRRLLAHVPVGGTGGDPPRVREWLLAAVAPSR